MLTLKAELFVSAISELASVRQILSQSFESQPDIIRKEILDLLAGLSSHLKTLDAKITKMAVDELTGNLSTDAVHTIDELRRSLDDIDATFRRELTDTGLIVLNSLEAALFAPTYPLFGVDVATKFPSVNYEIAEAGKCLALGRSTAGAFHSIRCLEAGIRAISRCLEIPDPTRGADRSWFKILRLIKGEIDHRWNPSAIVSAGDHEFFENAYAAIAGMQNPWRNSTMHLDQIYTLDDSLHIFEIVKGFMRKISSRMDEDGNPKAQT